MNRRQFLKSAIIGSAAFTLPLSCKQDEKVVFKIKPVYGKTVFSPDWDGKEDYFWQGVYWTPDEVSKLYARKHNPYKYNRIKELLSS